MPPPTSYKAKRDAMQAFALLGTKREMKTPETINQSKKRKESKKGPIGEHGTRRQETMAKKYKEMQANNCIRKLVEKGDSKAEGKNYYHNIRHRLIQNGSKMLSPCITKIVDK